MKLHPRVNRTAVELVERFEGLRRRAARLPDGGWTIGYGHTRSAREGAVVSPEDAEALLYYDLSEVATRVEAWTFTSLNQNQFEALIAFAFNIGLENFRRSTVLKRVNEGQHLQAAAAMELWRKSEVDGEGLVVDALVRRRAAEKAHYLTPPEGFRPSPTQVLKPAFDHSVIEAAAHSHMARRAAVVDAPLDGDDALAAVEHPAAGAASAAEAPSSVEPAGGQAAQRPQDAPAQDDPAASSLADEAKSEAEVEAPAVTVAEAFAASPFLRGPDAPAMNDTAPDQPFPSASVQPPPAFRGFEPPPPRFGRAGLDSPVAANEHQIEAESPDVHDPAEAAPQPEFSLFDRPLAPPAPAAASPPRTGRLRDDDAPDGEAVLAGVERKPLFGGALQNRTVVWGAVGCVGIVLFALAVSSMMIGQPTPMHLGIGLLGVVLITLAGIHFLLSRTAPAADEPAAPTRSEIVE